MLQIGDIVYFSNFKSNFFYKYNPCVVLFEKENNVYAFPLVNKIDNDQTFIKIMRSASNLSNKLYINMSNLMVLSKDDLYFTNRKLSYFDNQKLIRTFKYISCKDDNYKEILDNVINRNNDMSNLYPNGTGRTKEEFEKDVKVVYKKYTLKRF